jgi:hypothetical protein
VTTFWEVSRRRLEDQTTMVASLKEAVEHEKREHYMDVMVSRA